MSNRNTPFLLNGVSFSDGKFLFGGTELPGIRGLDISGEMDKNNKFGAGIFPIARGRGVKDYGGSIDMDLETRNIIMKANPPSVDMMDILPQNLVITFDNGVEVINVTVTMVEFKNDGVAVSQGDDEVVRSYDVVCGLMK